MECIQDLSGEERARFGFVLCFVNLGRKPSFCIHEKKRVVIKLILYDEYVLASFSRFPVVFVIKRQIYIEFRVFWKGKKEELEVRKTKMGYCTFSGLCRDR